MESRSVRRSSSRSRSPASPPAASKGFIYVRAEYPLAHERAAARDRRERAVPRRVRARAAHRRRRVRLRRGDGALPVDRGLPRRAALEAAVPGRGRPLRQADRGQQRRDAAQRARHRARRRRRLRRDRHEGSTGTRLFCVSGCVERPGPLRAPVRQRRCASCSSSPASAPPKAVLLGGAAGCVRRARSQLDLPLTLEDARAAGVTLGSGVVIVYDEEAELVPALLRIAEFFRDESCGQCVPCRVGTVRQEEALHRLAAGSGHGRRARDARRAGAGDARRVHLRPRADCGQRGRLRDREPGGLQRA